MQTLTDGFLGVAVVGQNATPLPAERAGQNGEVEHPRPPDAEFLRRCAWEIGEGRPGDAYSPAEAHVGLGAVAPGQGFAHWRIPDAWVGETARQKGDAWHNCRLVLRLYDVSLIEFNGFNAHQIVDHTLPGLCGQMCFRVPRPGTWQLAEVGFLLRNGEFVPAARSGAVPFPPAGPSPRSGQAALLVDDRGHIEELGNVWEQERVLRERRTPRLRGPLRSAALAFAAQGAGHDGWLATFVTELAAGQSAAGHEVHVFVPATGSFSTARESAGVHYHPLEVSRDGTPLKQARSFALAAEERFRRLPPFDLVHLHEWMAGVGPRLGNCRTVLSLSSLETTRRNGTPVDGMSRQLELSREIQVAERAAARAADCVLTPHWLRDRAAAELGLDNGRVRAFPMEGRMANEWEAPLDFGRVKMRHGIGPLDRMLLYVGPLEHAAGVDLLVEALPTALRRHGNLRLAYVGNGPMQRSLERRANELGVAWAVRFLGHQGGSDLTQLLRASEALVLPSRYRIPLDDAVVDLARKAGRPVVTTQGGPAHLVRHEETGLVTYDNPGSMVWALDRIIGDPGHSERMGQNGRRSEGGTMRWSEVARQYLESCVAWFPELTVRRM